MWNRWQLKESAKTVLRASYWKAFLVSLITAFISSNNLFSYRFNQADLDVLSHSAHLSAIVPFLAILGLSLTASIAGIILIIFIFAPLHVGIAHYFLESTQMRFDFQNVLHGFTGGRYRNVVATMLLRDIYLFLWTLLLIVPGIVKSYSYALVPFLLAENPSLSPSRAIQMSINMTNGHKWEMFILDLSFLGWYLLGLLALVVGTLFVNPYYYTTQAQLYLALRNIAIDNQIISLGDLEMREI